MTFEILKIRLLQVYRLLQGIGLIRIIFLVFLLAFLAFSGYKLLIQEKNTTWTLIILGILLFVVHAGRKDKRFLKLLTKNPYQIYLCEYLIITLPVFIIWIISTNWTGISFLFIICFLLPFIYLNMEMQNTSSFVQFLINPFRSNLNFRINLRLPLNPYAFEWISGIRRNFIVLLPLYLFIFAFSYRPYVAPVGIILLSIMITSFYSFGENREFIEIFALTPKQFINRKIFTNWRYLTILFLPVLIVAFIFQPQTWYYLIGSFIISLIIQVFAIIFKYALFEENASLNRNGMIVFLNILFILVPLFWPVPIVTVVRYYFKAKENLKKYFNA